MFEFRADLHCHSTASDGSLTPAELVRYAKKIGLSGLSITDHDTIEAYQTAIPVAREEGIFLGSGVEFSSVDQGVSVHILGYDIDLENEALKAFCRRHVDRRNERNRQILDKLADRGMLIELEELKTENGHPGGRPHIAMALVRKGFVSSVEEAFKKYIGDGMPFFAPGTPISTDETINVIHNAEGKVFIAHPHLLKSSRTMQRLLQKPIDGIECYYAKCSPEQEAKWLKLAEERKLLVSGGSDFHGSVKPGIPLGASWVDRVRFDLIFERNRWS